MIHDSFQGDPATGIMLVQREPILPGFPTKTHRWGYSLAGRRSHTPRQKRLSKEVNDSTIPSFQRRMMPVIGARTMAVKYPAMASTIQLPKSAGSIPAHR
jgi:hypothetical protein